MADTPSSDPLIRSRLARTLTSGAFTFLIIVATTALVGGAIYSWYAPSGDDKRATFFFEVAKYILATVVPVVAGWVGTVLAFYYGKENFEAGTRSVTTTAQALTSKQKLATTMVATLGKELGKFTALVLNEDQSKAPDKVTLDKVDPAFGPVPPQDKPYERLPILLAGNLPYTVLHRSTMNSFVVDVLKKDPTKTTGGLTLAELFTHVGSVPEKNFVIVAESETADAAKQRMESVKNCSDVFVTADGTAKSAVKRWITNVDLLQALEV